ncbi:MAG: hypothetical protein M0031_06520 [Thermaerobacter sp.]|jgi:hypothetical protein|nr:hypothetical protein [Thermaerobacter sp.]
MRVECLWHQDRLRCACGKDAMLRVRLNSGYSEAMCVTCAREFSEALEGKAKSCVEPPERRGAPIPQPAT